MRQNGNRPRHGAATSGENFNTTEATARPVNRQQDLLDTAGTFVSAQVIDSSWLCQCAAFSEGGT